MKRHVGESLRGRPSLDTARSSSHEGRPRRGAPTSVLLAFALCHWLFPLCSSLSAQKTESKSEMAAAKFPQLVNEYLQDLHSRHPTLAAGSGIHAWDGHLEDYSAAAIAAEISAIRGFQARLEKIPPLELALSDTFDYQILLSNMRARLLELEQI